MRQILPLCITLSLLSCVAQALSSYDYIIVGGGTAGLTIAARLSEDRHVSVLVLEAGHDHSNDTKVLSPGLYTSMYGDPEYDWNYKTVPQKHANNQVVAHPRGKQLGGSSAINLLFWTHASRQDLDNWGLLGNANWSWSSVEPYFTKSEAFVGPSATVTEDLKVQWLTPSVHGKKGPIQNTIPDTYGPLDEAWPRAYETLGMGVNGDPRDGLALGGYTVLINMDLKSHTRSYAATGYYGPAKKRPNLTVLTGALVENVFYGKDKKSGLPLATGVQYSVDGVKVKVKAKKEIILCAGAIGSPQILELSGIGDPALLKSLDINVVYGNKNVGENLQDHFYVPIGYAVVPGIVTLDNFTDFAFFEAAYEEYVTNATGLLATTGAKSGLLSCPQIGCDNLIPPSSFPSTLRSGLREQYKLLSKHYQSEAVAQTLGVSGGMSPQFANDSSKLFGTSSAGNFFTILGVLEHPFSRGNTHIKSSDPIVYPTLDPNYLSHSFDLTVLSAITLHLQVIAQTKPLSNLLKGNGTVCQPGYFKLDKNNVGAWVRGNVQSEFHPCGTAAMLPKDKGGVVDERFRVYGVKGLRVVDASVFPLIPRANLQTLVYAIAERGADFLKEDALL